MSSPRHRTSHRNVRERQPEAQRRKRRPRGVIPILKYRFTRMLKKIKRSPLVPLSGGLLLLCAVLALLIWMFTNKNAFDVYVGTGTVKDTTMQNVATVPMSKNVTDEWIYNLAKAKLEADINTKIQVDQHVELVPVHSSKKKMSPVEYAVSRVYKQFSESGYKVDASEIFIDNIPIALVKNAAEATKLQDEIIGKYLKSDTEPISKGFVEEFKVVSRFVPSAEIMSTEKAIAKLTAGIEQEIDYTVQDNDSVWKICNRNGISRDEFYKLNPQLSPDSILKVGSTVKLVLAKPVLSVKTVEEVTYIGVEKCDIERRPNNTKAKGYDKVIQQGKDGQKQVIGHQTYINGVPSGEPVEVSSSIIVAPIVRIIEVGTK